MGYRARMQSTLLEAIHSALGIIRNWAKRGSERSLWSNVKRHHVRKWTNTVYVLVSSCVKWLSEREGGGDKPGKAAEPGLCHGAGLQGNKKVGCCSQICIFKRAHVWIDPIFGGRKTTSETIYYKAKGDGGWARVWQRGIQRSRWSWVIFKRRNLQDLVMDWLGQQGWGADTDRGEGELKDVPPQKCLVSMAD